MGVFVRMIINLDFWFIILYAYHKVSYSTLIYLHKKWHGAYTKKNKNLIKCRPVLVVF